MKERQTSAGGECHKFRSGKGAYEGGPGLRAQRKVVRVVGLPLVLPGTKFPLSKSSLISSHEVQHFSGDLPSFLPAAETGQKQSPGLCRNESTQEGGAQRRIGVRNPAHNEGPLEHSSKFLKSQLLEYEATTTSSLGAKCVCHYSRPPARPPPSPAR